MSRLANAIATLVEGCADAIREASGVHSEFEYKQLKQELLDVKAQLIEANAERDELYEEIEFVRKEHDAHKAYVEKQSARLREALEPLRNEGEAHDTEELLGRIKGLVNELRVTKASHAAVDTSMASQARAYRMMRDGARYWAPEGDLRDVSEYNPVSTVLSCNKACIADVPLTHWIEAQP